MPGQTDDGAEVTEHGIALLKANQSTLKLKGLHYGDLQIIGTVPTVCVEPAKVEHEYTATGLQQENQFDIGFIVYHTGRGGPEGVQRDADITTKALRTIINLDARPVSAGGTLWGGLLFEGLVSSIEYGYAVLTDETMRANRIIFTGRSKTEA